MSATHSKSTLLLAAGGLMLNRALLAARLRRRIDGWRRAAALMLRDECSTFVLSAFGLDIWSDAPPGPRSIDQTRAHAAQRLAAFLAAEPVCHLAVERGPIADRVHPVPGPSYTLAFEPWAPGPARFMPPDHWHGERSPATPAQSGVFKNIILRISDAGRADVWVRVNHAAADGVPVQELLSRLQSAWGGDAVYPSPAEFAPFERPRTVEGRPELCIIQAFVDFAPLLAWRKRENARLPEPMTVSAAMLWCFAQTLGDHPIGTTVEVAPAHGLDRGVGVVVTRPEDYPAHADGLSRYVRDFNRDLELTRLRASASCKTLDAAAFLPAKLELALLRHALDRTPRAFGTLALTMLKDARVFGVPIGAAGHARGFIAVGSLALPTAGGGRVGCITVKGPRGVIDDYPARIRQAVESCKREEPG